VSPQAFDNFSVGGASKSKYVAVVVVERHKAKRGELGSIETKGYQEIADLVCQESVAGKGSPGRCNVVVYD